MAAVENTLTELLTVAYDLNGPFRIIPFTSGLINHSWKVESASGQYVLQRINTNVFQEPHALDANVSRVLDYLGHHFPGETYPKLIAQPAGSTFVFFKDGYYRLFHFIAGSRTFEVVSHPEQAYGAARQFGLFTARLERFPAGELNITIPRFHDLAWRQQQFEVALSTGKAERIADCSELIEQLNQYREITAIYHRIRGTKLLPLRVIHHDTKISNVLFDEAGSAICPIDLDTVMPGYIISDLGDMMRTYLSPVDENEADLSKVSVRPEMYQAVMQGYRAGLGNALQREEEKYLHYSGSFMIYMQALRFLTDHLNNDIYYGATFAGQNKLRAANQLHLLSAYGELKLES